MSDSDFVGSGAATDGKSVAFDYIKSSDFRTVWADGAIGGITPAGMIHFAVYSERPAIPRRQVFALEAEGEEGQKLGPEIMEKRIARDAFVREMPMDVVISINVAESLAQWLTQQVELIRKSQQR